jgi:signal transduction histidine kinase
LGLVIVKAIVETHGGSIGVESLPGEGTRFRVFLPVDAPAPAQSAA